MRRIRKGNEPPLLTQWKKAHPHGRYQALPAPERQAIRAACIEEQHGLCAHCCHALTLDKIHNEHVEAQDLAPHRSLDYSNIVASCNHSKQCGDAHKSRILPLTCLMDECESELKFYLSGRVEGLTERAITTIEVLNLGDSREKNRKLCSTRKALVEALLFSENIEPKESLIVEDEILTILMEDLQRPDERNRLKPFAPVLVNIIRHLQH